MNPSAQYFIDITGEVCPMTFVKTKLQIEKIGAGEILEVRLKGEEPLKNVPRSVVELGHQILEKTAEPGEGPLGIHRLIIKKSS